MQPATATGFNQLDMVETILVFCIVLVLSTAVRKAYFHPLSSVPGPLIARISPLWLWYHAWRGDEPSQILALHDRYGPVVRIGPDDIDIADGAALFPIYSEKGGFLKHPCYANFHIEGHATLFSALDPEHRKARAKAVAPSFAPSNIYAQSEKILASADTFIDRLRGETAGGRPGNVLNLARCFALDSLSAYLFGRRYGGLQEESEQLSAAEFVDYFVAFGRFFLLPGRLFDWLLWISDRFWLDDASARSLAKVDVYVHGLVEASAQKLERGDSEQETYQSRLLRAGFSRLETESQCKDLIFAGTDSTGMNLSTLCWQLTRPCNRPVYEKLRKEIQDATVDSALETEAARVQTLPYLRAVVLEGLRISNANPTRLPRIVAPGGWSWLGFDFPSGTSVGIGAYQLHGNREIFPSPEQFRPDRWLDPSPEMQRDHFAFGAGARQCVARNLATAELLLAVARIAEKDALRDLEAIGDGIKIVEWFNSVVIGGKVELRRVKPT